MFNRLRLFHFFNSTGEEVQIRETSFEKAKDRLPKYFYWETFAVM